MCSHPPFCWGRGERGVEPTTKFSKRGYLIGPQLEKVTKNLVTFKRKDSVKDEKL